MCYFLQEPVRISVGEKNYANRVLKSDFLYYVPVGETLKQLVQHSEIHEQILNHHIMYLRMDICDGSVCTNNPNILLDPRTITLVAYHDEIELCNPLGSASKKNKLGCVFFTLGNIHPALRSTLKAIFLVAVANVPTIDTHGIDLVLKPFIEDIKDLTTNGLILSDGLHFLVSLVAFLPNNLAARALGGFKGSMSFAKRICQTCMTTTEKAQIYFHEDAFDLRTPSQHIDYLKSLQSDSTGSISIDVGINRRSILQDLPNFSVAANLPHDIMHDLFKGVFPYELKLFLAYCLSSKYFMLGTLNERIVDF